MVKNRTMNIYCTLNAHNFLLLVCQFNHLDSVHVFKVLFELHYLKMFEVFWFAYNFVCIFFQLVRCRQNSFVIIL